MQSMFSDHTEFELNQKLITETLENFQKPRN